MSWAHTVEAALLSQEVDGARLYWGTVTNPGEAIWMCDLAQCGASARMIASVPDANPGIIPWSLSVDPTSIYFVDHVNPWAYRLAKP